MKCARLMVLLVCLAVAGGAMGLAAEAVYFRHDSGVAAKDEAGLPAELDDEQLVWNQELPPGHSTPCVIGDRVIVTAHEGNELVTIMLDRDTGKMLWRQGIRVEQLEKTHNEGSPASATPACDGQRVFSFFGSYGLLCYSMEGAQLWTKKLGPFRDEFGSSSSPILADGKVILNEDHDLDSFLIAVRQDNGETAWQIPRDGFTRSYATPVIWEVGGVKQLVIAGALQMVAYDLAEGKPLWSLDGFARIVNTTPAQVDQTLFVCTWSPGGDSDARIAMEPWNTALDLWDKNGNKQLENAELPAGEVRSRFYRIDLDSNSALDELEWGKYARLFELAQNTMVALRPGEPGQPPQTMWEYKRGLPYVSSPLVYQGQVYLVKDGGIVTLLDAANGKLLKQGRARGDGNYYASPVGGDGKVYLASGPGVVTVLKAGPRIEVLASHDFSERIAATPVIADGQLFVRTEKGLYCFAER